MQFSINKDALNRALKQVGSAINVRTVHPILANVLIETLDASTVQFTGTDLDITIQVKCPVIVTQQGATTLPAKKLQELVSRLESDQVNFNLIDPCEVLITSKRSKFKMSAVPSEDYPKIAAPKSNGNKIKADQLKRALQLTTFSAAAYDQGSILGSVFVNLNDSLNTVATDGSRLSHKETEVSLSADKEVKILLPARAANELQKLFADGDLSIVLDNQEATFFDDSCSFTTRLIGGEYPRYFELFPKEFACNAVLSVAELNSALERVSVLSDERTNMILMTFTKGQLEIAANTPDLGEATEEITCDYSGADLKIALNVRYLFDVLGQLKSCKDLKLNMNGELKPIIVESEQEPGFRYLLMPVQKR